MEFARDILQIPVPLVYEYSTTSSNPVGTEYIIMEEAAGESLESAWPKLSADGKLSVMHELVSLEAKLSSISFSRYGSLYFTDDKIPNAAPATISTLVSASLKDKVAQRFSIGPVCNRAFWRKEFASLDLDRGPWSEPSDYATAIGLREIRYLDTIRPQIERCRAGPVTAQDDPQQHVQLLNRYLKAVPQFLNIGHEYTRATPFHTDLHCANLFVDKQHITAVLDWQGIWAGPLFLLSRPSPVINYTGTMVLSRPDNFDDLSWEEQDRLRQQITSSTLQQLYQYKTKQRNPDLAAVFDLDHGKTRRLPIEYAGDTWDENLVPFRETLINIERYWKAINDAVVCPIHFSSEEIQSHLRDAGGWNEAQDFFDKLDGVVARDGWTRCDTFEKARKAFYDLQDKYLKRLEGHERLNFERYTSLITG